MVFVLPVSWFMPVFVASIAATLLCGLIARLSVKDDSPINPVVDLVAAVLSVPSRPSTRIPSGWALHSFVIVAAFVVSLALSVVVRANA